MIDPSIEDFIRRQPHVVQETVVWGNGIRLELTSFLGVTLPPLDLISSVRGVVVQANMALVVRDPESVHILPGGRREPGESLEETLRREILEESGWTLHLPRYLGGRLFRHLTPKPAHYPYPYPYFFQVVFLAQAEKHQPAARHTDGYEVEATFIPLATIHTLALTAGERLFLTAVPAS